MVEMTEAIKKEPLGDTIKRAIRGKGFTSEDAAKKLGISRATLHNKLKGAEHDVQFIQLVKERLGISIQQKSDDSSLITESELINYNIPIRRKKIATVMLPKDITGADIDIIISHLKIMKATME